MTKWRLKLKETTVFLETSFIYVYVKALEKFKDEQKAFQYAKSFIQSLIPRA